MNIIGFKEQLISGQYPQIKFHFSCIYSLSVELRHFYCKIWESPFLDKTFFSILEISIQWWPGGYGGWITIPLGCLQPEYLVHRPISKKSPHVWIQSPFLGNFQHSKWSTAEFRQHLLTKIFSHLDLTLKYPQLKGFVKILISHQDTAVFRKSG